MVLGHTRGPQSNTQIQKLFFTIAIKKYSKLIEIMGIHFKIFGIFVALPWDFEEQIP